MVKEKPALSAAAVKTAPSPTEAAPKAASLKERIQFLKRDANCGGIIAMEWHASWPIPIRKSDKEYYKVLFYPVSPPLPKEGQESVVLAPTVEADIPYNEGEPVECRALDGGSEEFGPVLSVAAQGIEFSQFMEMKDEFYWLIERTAALYFDSSGLGGGNPETLLRFFDTFSLLHEPGLKRRYFELNADFWKWIEARTGKTL
ncbi:MAG: hypothetical protein A3G41_06360 [Elusimicrobia bacterium RIFCSPLOWO2_12_FULL_59_9]|nr:MAG: hypothetical protein A3G41_06360 [Elusimicrobia bacterium RIFCSPLOWO2_12_FULL_59_9]